MFQSLLKHILQKEFMTMLNILGISWSTRSIGQGALMMMS